MLILVHFWLSSGIVLAEASQNPWSAVPGIIFAPGQSRTEQTEFWQNSGRFTPARVNPGPYIPLGWWVCLLFRCFGEPTTHLGPTCCAALATEVLALPSAVSAQQQQQQHPMSAKLNNSLERGCPVLIITNNCQATRLVGQQQMIIDGVYVVYNDPMMYSTTSSLLSSVTRNIILSFYFHSRDKIEFGC